MTIFVVLRVTDPTAMEAAVKRSFPQDHIQLHDDEWLISAEMTAADVSEKLGVTSSDNVKSTVGSAIIFSTRGYYGRAASNVWDWIRTKTEALDG